MKITHNTPNLLVLRFTRWKGPLVYALITLYAIWIGVRIIVNLGLGWGPVILWLLVTVAWSLPLAILRAERSMLVLDGDTGEAELRHRTSFGLHRHRWPLSEVQSTRVTRFNCRGPAEKDPSRLITLFVREGMDEGRHKLTKYTVAAEDALAASARVSDWMRDWRARLDSPAPPP